MTITGEECPGQLETLFRVGSALDDDCLTKLDGRIAMAPMMDWTDNVHLLL
jgi:hypothetical protein